MALPTLTPRSTGRLFVLLAAVLSTVALPQPAKGQIEFEREPIDYQNAPSHDPVAQLQTKLDAGEIKLAYDKEHGYLPAVLEHLGVSPASQMLVFSKTSFQLRRIDPTQPRAVYFNDSAYVGWVQDGDVVELSAVDPQLGAVFYTLSQQKTDKPVFVRDKGQCIVCHASSRTQGVPGHLVRSVFTDTGGQPQLGSGTFTTDHRSPFSERWGGWYVSGTHGEMRHLGNIVSRDKSMPENVNRDNGANVTNLSKLVNVDPYLRPTSDLVALMVMEHQTQMHNLITLANYETRSAIHYDGIMNKALKRADDFQSDSTGRRIATVGDRLLKYMLLTEEFELTSPVAGVSTFAKEFSQSGARDSKGRSLRDLDLNRRLFKYPCSYLIYSQAFDSLPQPVKQYVLTRLNNILRGTDTAPEFARLTAEDRQAVLEILQETKPGIFDRSNLQAANRSN